MSRRTFSPEHYDKLDLSGPNHKTLLGKLATMENNIQETESELAAANKRIKELEVANTQSEDKCEKLNSQLTKLEKESDEDHKTLLGKLATMENNIQETESELAAANKREGDCATDYKVLYEQAQAIQEKYRELYKDCSTFKNGSIDAKAPDTGREDYIYKRSNLSF